MPLFRITDIALIMMLVLIISYTYIIKNNSHRLNKEKIYLCKQIEEQKNALEQLKIEWAYVTSPSHINNLMQNYGNLHLGPIKPNSVVSINKLSFRS